MDSHLSYHHANVAMVVALIPRIIFYFSLQELSINMVVV